MEELIEVSAADALASIVSGTGKSTLKAVVHPVSYRAPVHLLARVDALAAKSGKSRNAMINLLVDVGLEEVLSRLSDDDFEEVQSREMYAAEALRGADSESLEE
ncbi:MAG: hypothetical protein Q7T44_18620 [Parvibaculum sp.]|nr:hypothetical protein [Parvibaculum sp.]